jgi:hypothetical protein
MAVDSLVKHKKKVGVFEVDNTMRERYEGFLQHWGHEVIASASFAEEVEIELARLLKEKIAMDVAVVDLAPNPELANDNETEEDNETVRAVQAIRKSFLFAKIIVIKSVENVEEDVDTILDKMDLAGLREEIEEA